MANVILVDKNNSPRGVMEKLEAHRKGELHRAFSIFIFNSKGELLLQKRAAGKYHSGGLWSNTCCGHPEPGKSAEECAHTRLKEEMGFDCGLEYGFDFIYRAELDRGLTEHELDQIFIGRYDGTPVPAPEEVSEWKYQNPDLLRGEIKADPERFTAWFKMMLPGLLKYVKAAKGSG